MKPEKYSIEWYNNLLEKRNKTKMKKEKIVNESLDYIMENTYDYSELIRESLYNTLIKLKMETVKNLI